MAVLRRELLRSALSEERAALAIGAYLDLPIRRHGHEPFLGRILDLRANFSAYAATYVALAEDLDGVLLTADDRLARAARAHTAVPVLP